MKKKLFKELVKSIKQAGKIRRGSVKSKKFSRMVKDKLGTKKYKKLFKEDKKMLEDFDSIKCLGGPIGSHPVN